MIDPAVLRSDPDLIRDALRRRGVEVDVGALEDLDVRRRKARSSAEELRARQREISKGIPRLEGEERETAIAEAGKLSDEYKTALAEADELDERFNATWETLPNLVDPTAAEGFTDEDNETLRHWGKPPEFGFDVQDHLDLGTALGVIDVERAAKVSGSRFAYLKGRIVRLEFAIVSWALDRLGAAGFEPVVPPYLVREQALFGTGFFPGDRDQVYAIEADDLYLIGTSEVSLAAMHADEIFEDDHLPRKYVGFSSCFRREAGTYGKDTRGIFRVHQFDKVEMFVFCRPGESPDVHDQLLEHEEALVRELELPYRVVNVAAGDLGASAAKKYDIEAWMPGQEAYREITSTSNTTDYQSRRLMIRYRAETGNELVHTLNGTAVAIGRTLIAIMENNQQSDGSIRVPEVLVPYAGFDTIGPGEG